MATDSQRAGRGFLSIEADLTLRVGSHQASLTAKGTRLQLATQEFVGALAFYRALPPRVGGLERRQLVALLHRQLVTEGLSLQLKAGRVELGTIGLNGPTGVFVLLVGRS